MSDKPPPIYCGTAKKVEFEDGGSIMKVSFTEDHLRLMHSHLDNGWVNVVISKRREPSERGQTHSVKIDTWKPRPQGDNAPQGSTEPQGAPEHGAGPAPGPEDDDNCPF